MSTKTTGEEEMPKIDIDEKKSIEEGMQHADNSPQETEHADNSLQERENRKKFLKMKKTLPSDWERKNGRLVRKS